MAIEEVVERIRLKQRILTSIWVFEGDKKTIKLL